MGNYNLNKIGAIIITYNPDVPRLRLNLNGCKLIPETTFKRAYNE